MVFDLKEEDISLLARQTMDSLLPYAQKFHVELRFAMEIASRMPLDEIFVLPVRLDECALPRMLEAQIQSVDLFPDWERGLETLTAAMHQQMEARGKR